MSSPQPFPNRVPGVFGSMRVATCYRAKCLGSLPLEARLLDCIPRAGLPSSL